ncbi:hypothetical protein [Streptomyces tailanensis]|nr:hypothetical protein [Streptomyces tailanensis]
MARKEFPPAGDVRSVESWTCPRFAAEIAEKSVERLEGLYEEDAEGEW